MQTQIKNTTKTELKIDWDKIKNTILGKDYELSLLLCADKLARRINKEYRRKNYVPNTLSFPYDKKSGEILININKAFKEARGFSHSNINHVIFLYIHSLLHLSGLTHGHKMEKEEKKFFEKFKV